ncbi:MAG: hypothetical protein IKE75_04655 [Bacilli bacterium]|nr:hypothetical protein [Bacilli bacterium]
MKQNFIFYSILLFALIMAITLPRVTQIVYESSKEELLASYTAKNDGFAKAVETEKSTAKVAKEAQDVELAIADSVVKEEEKEEVKEETSETKKPDIITKEEVKQEVLAPAKAYKDMTTEELVQAINDGNFKLEYSAVYSLGISGLSKAKGAMYFEGHKETYYSQRVLPGTSLNIPGRHVADDGTVRDGSGYIVVAANTSYLSRGTIVKTSLGPGKVYDSGCASGIVDLYTNW